MKLGRDRAKLVLEQAKRSNSCSALSNAGNKDFNNNLSCPIHFVMMVIMVTKTIK
jgi:hypothetical protein